MCLAELFEENHTGMLFSENIEVFFSCVAILENILLESKSQIKQQKNTMSEIFLRQVKQLALHRLRGNESQPEYPHQKDQDETTKNPNYLWARPQIPSLWSSLEQAIINTNEQKQKMSSPGSNHHIIISPTRDTKSNSNSNSNANNQALPYLMYRQMVCRELAKELGFVPEGLDADIDEESMSIEDRAKILSMYRQHLTCGPATYFDSWRNQNKEAILKSCERNNNNNLNHRLVAPSSLREPSLVDVMSQIGAVNFFADLRSLLEGIRNDRIMKGTHVTATNNNSEDVTRKSSASSNTVFKNLHQRLCRSYNIHQHNHIATSNKKNDESSSNTEKCNNVVSIPPLPLHNEDVLHSHSNATLTVEDLENFVKALIPNIRGARDSPPWLQPYYIAHAVARIAFDAESASRNSKSSGSNNITISSVLESAALTDLLQLHESHAPDAALCFPRNLPVNIGIEHGQLVQLEDDDLDENADHERPKPTPEQEAALYKKKHALLKMAIQEAKEASDPDEITLVEAAVIYCPDSDCPPEENFVLVNLTLSDDQDIQLRVPRQYTYLPSSREALQRYREIMELLVGADEAGNRVSAAELDERIMMVSSPPQQRNNNNNKKGPTSSSSGNDETDFANTVDDVDSSVVLSRTRRIMAENWFSLPRMLALYYDFCILDHDHDGVLRHDELKHYRNGALTNLAIDRVFEVFSPAGSDQSLAYTSYLDFVIAMEYPHLAASQRYLWKILDLDSTGNSISVRSLMFFAIEICNTLLQKHIVRLSPEGLMNELLDMLRSPADADSVNFDRNVLASKMGGTVLPLLLDWHSFIKYESREQQRQAESIDEQLLEEDGGEKQEEHDEDDDADDSGSDDREVEMRDDDEYNEEHHHGDEHEEDEEDNNNVVRAELEGETSSEDEVDAHGNGTNEDDEL